MQTINSKQIYNKQSVGRGQSQKQLQKIYRLHNKYFINLNNNSICLCFTVGNKQIYLHINMQ